VNRSSSSGLPEHQRLLDAGVAAALTGYRPVLELGDPAPVALVLAIYWDGDAVYQLAPPPVALPSDRLAWCEAHGRQAEAWDPFAVPERAGVELAMPELDDDPVMLALLELLRDDEEEDLLERYLELLAARLTLEIGVPVLVQGVDAGYGRPLGEQLRDRLTPEQHADLARRDLLPRDRSADWVLREWDVVLYALRPDGGVAGIHRVGDRLLLGRQLSPSMGSAGRGTPLEGPLRDDGGDPQVVGGLLPPGAARVEVTDLFDEVHPAQIAAGAWLCMLPHSGRGGEPPVRFLDASGRCLLSLPVASAQDESPGEAWISFSVPTPAVTEDERAAALARREAEEEAEARAVIGAAGFEVSWPATIGGVPELTSWDDPQDGPVMSLSLRAGDIVVELGVTEYRDDIEPARSSLDAYADALDATMPRRERARLVELAQEIRIPGRWEGREVEFIGRAGAGRWSAIAVIKRRRYAIVTGSGVPPERLDLIPVES
jgi:hypothetical protein